MPILCQTHPNSGELFFRKWTKWLTKLKPPHADIQSGFVWILGDRGQSPAPEDVPEKAVALRAQTKIVHLGFKRLRVTVQEIDQEIGLQTASGACKGVGGVRELGMCLLGLRSMVRFLGV